MVRAPVSQRVTVRLAGIPLRHQGTHDSLCAYYAAAMLLCALRPEFDDEFDAAHVRRDPIFGNLPRRRGQKVERQVSDWIATGVHLDRVCDALNAACARGAIETRFEFRAGNKVRGNVEFLREQVDRGLPCVLGWESRELGNHTVLVLGYERYATTGGEWLRVNDPSRVQDLLEWGQLQRLADRRLDLLWCVEHAGVRPDKVTTHRGKHGILPKLTRVERWSPASRRYAPLV
jgi:hypothetical protein